MGGLGFLRLQGTLSQHAWGCHGGTRLLTAPGDARLQPLRFCPRNKRVGGHRHMGALSLTGPMKWGGRRAAESTLQDLWGVQGEKGFREIQQSTTEVCVYVCVMGSDFIISSHVFEKLS